MTSSIATVHESFLSARDAVRRLERIEARLGALAKQREQVATRQEALALRYEVEKDDVEDLEGAIGETIMRLFSAGKRSDLERERKEAAAVKLELDEASGELAAVDREIAELQEEERSLSSASTTLAEVSEQLGELVREMDPEVAAQLDQFGEREAFFRHQCVEIEQAMQAGLVASEGLGQIMERLGTSRKIEIGTTLGGGLIGSGDSLASELALESATHLHVHGIRSDMGRIRADLLRFQDECKDVATGPDVGGMKLEPMPGVLDFIVADLLGWHILEVIADARWRIEKTQDEVQLAYANLRHRRTEMQAKLDEVVAQRATLLAACM